MFSKKVLREMPLHLMLLPGVILVLIFCYGPMTGIIMAFEKFMPSKGMYASPFIGLDNFKYIIDLPGTFQVLWNTVYIAMMKIFANLFIPVLFALLLNEVGNKWIKRTIQTGIYFPYFLSWIILGGIMIDILSPSEGIINKVIGSLGFQQVFFLGDERSFPYVMVFSDAWKNFGFGTIVYLAALSGIDPNLYEAGYIDGANRWKQTLHITIPGILSTIVLMATLSLGNVLNAGFDQIFNLYSPQVYSTGDIIDTLVYRLGIVDVQYSVATAVGLFKSVVSFTFIAVSYKLANRFANYRIF